MANQDFADAVRARTLVFPAAPDGTIRRGSSTNLLLSWYPGTIGVKTGFTSQALLTFVAAAERDDRRLYAVVLGSDGDRAHFADVEELFDYGFHDLGYYGHAATGTPYVALMGRRSPSPLIVQGNMETYMHLAGQGLMLERPAPMFEAPEPEPPPIVEVMRTAESGPRSILDTMRFWLDQALITE
jgi:hypothetical protein